MAPIAELVSTVGRLHGHQAPDKYGVTLTVKVLFGNASQRCTACALTPDAAALGLATDGGAVYALHLNKQRYTQLDVLDKPGTAVVFMTRLSRRLFVGCSNGEIHCFDIACRSSRLAKLPGHRAAIASLSTKSDTEQLLSASADAVLLWDMQTFRQRRMLSSAPYGSSQATFSQFGNIIAVAAASGDIIVWNTRDLRELPKLRTPLGLQQKRFIPSCLSISPDERWLVAGCRAPALLLVYSLQGMQLVHALLLPQESYGIVQVQLLPDSTSAAVLASEGSISFLDIQAGQCTAQLQATLPGSRASSFAMDACANSMATVCADGLVRLYDLAFVRRAAEQQRPLVQVQKLQESQLQNLPAGVAGAISIQKQHSSSQAAESGKKGQASVQVLCEVGNLPAKAVGSKAAKRGQVGSNAAGAKKKPTGLPQLQTRPLDAAAAALNKRKLLDMLRMYGEFPARYRLLIWEHVLQLPHNSAAFSLLQDKGVHPAFKDIAQQMPGGCRTSQAVRLQACLSQLAHWCPLFGEAGFLPRFAFPFMAVFGAKAESAFELMATLLLNWCKGWFELFPNPPLGLLRRFLLLLSHHDLELGGHLQQLGAPLLQQLWQQLSGALSDVFPSKDDWLSVWDHCLAAPSGPDFLYYVLCSYLVGQRQLLLAAQDEQQLHLVFQSRPAIDVQQMLERAYKLQQTSPQYAQIGLAAFTPLPKASTEGCSSYPVFSEYPVGSVELQAMERRKIQEAEDALIRRRRVVAELEQRSKQVAFDSAALTAQRQQLAALDAQRRAAMRSIEDSMAAAAARLDDRAKEEKLKQIRLVEEAYQGSLSSLRAEWQAELAAVKSDLEHKRRQAAAALKARQEEEDLKALEFQAQQRIWALQQEELAAAGTSALQDASAAQAAALAAEQQRKAAEWQAQDDAQTLKQQHEAARRARLVAAAEQEAAQQAAKGLLLAQELQAQQELLKVDNQRKLRQLAEDEALLTAQQLQLQAERQAVLTAAGQAAVAQKAQEQQAKFTQQQEQRMAAVAAELEALKLQQQELHMAAADIGAAARFAASERQLAELENVLQQADAEHAARVEKIMQQLTKEKEAHEQVMQTLQETAAAAMGAAAAATTAATAAGEAPLDRPASATCTAAKRQAAKPHADAASLEERLQALTAEMQLRHAAPPAADVNRAHSRTTSAASSAVDGDNSGIAEPSIARAAQEGDTKLGWAAAYKNVGAELRQDKVLLQEVMSAAAGPAAASRSGASSVAISGSSKGRPGSSSISSLDVSQELEQLLAETEAEAQLEMSYREAAEAALQARERLQLQLQKEQVLAAARQAQQRVAQHAVMQRPVAETAPKPRGSSSAFTAGIAAGARLSTVTEEPSTSATVVRSASSQQISNAVSSPISSVTGSPVLQQSATTKKVVPKQAGSRPGTVVSTASPKRALAAELATAGLRPLTHRRGAVRGLAEALAQPATQPAAESSGSSSGSSSSRPGQPTWRRQQQQVAAQHPSPSSGASSALTETSTPGSRLSSSSGGAPQQESYSRAHELYEPVLLGVSGAKAVLTDGAVLLGRTTPSSGSTPGSSSQPSSLSFEAPVASASGHGLADRETPMLGIRNRARTTMNTSAMHGASTTAAAMQAAAAEAALRHSSSSSTASAAGEHDAVGDLGGRQRSGQLGLDPSGRVSAELRQSSSATSEELEQLLQQLAIYEEHLMHGEEPTAQNRAADNSSDVGTSMSSLSWSATLAGLASLLPQNQ